MFNCAFEISCIDELLGNRLLHAGRAGPNDGEFIEGVLGKVGINALRNEENVSVLRVKLDEFSHERRGSFHVSLLLIQTAQLHTQLDTQ